MCMKWNCNEFYLKVSGYKPVFLKINSESNFSFMKQRKSLTCKRCIFALSSFDK